MQSDKKTTDIHSIYYEIFSARQLCFQTYLTKDNTQLSHRYMKISVVQYLMLYLYFQYFQFTRLMERLAEQPFAYTLKEDIFKYRLSLQTSDAFTDVAPVCDFTYCKNLSFLCAFYFMLGNDRYQQNYGSLLRKFLPF